MPNAQRPTPNARVNITVNGKPQTLQEGATVAELLDSLDLAAGRRGVAVAIDAEVVPRTEWPRTEVAEGANVEVVVAIQGG
jgi:sulfur carrier protein